MDANTMFQVKNRSASMVVYSIPEDNIRRQFMPGEVKKIKYSELEKLSFQPGGRELMTNFLQLIAEEATEELGIHREPEYNMSEEQIKELILTGSLDSFLDCLDFAPVGIIDLIKAYSISLPMNDLEKRKALKEKTGFDVGNALRHKEEEAEDDNAPVEQKERRVKTAAPTGRRTTPEYKVVK